MSTLVRLIDLTQGSEPCLLGRRAADLLCGLREIANSTTPNSSASFAGKPITPKQLRAMLSYINPTFDGGSGIWVGIAMAILHGQLPVTDEIDWEELLDEWCSGHLWRERTGDEAFSVPTYKGKDELLDRLRGAPRTNGPTIGLGTIVMLARDGGYSQDISSPSASALTISLGATDDETEIRRLSTLSPVAYDRERLEAAKRLGIRVSVLDEAVRRDCPSNEGQIGQGRPLELPELEPWDEPVRGDELLSELSAVIGRYVVMVKALADGVALWVVGAHVFDCFVVFPRLAVLSPEKQCGKTTLLDVLTALVPRALQAANVSTAAVFRTIEMVRPTFLIDEADTFLQDNVELRGVLNSGHRRNGTVVRCVGDAAEPRAFSTWSPAVIAAIGHLPETLEDRSIQVSLRRRRQDEPIERLRLDRMNDLVILARKAARWAADNAPSLSSTDPDMPEELFNRAADNWRPLLAVADAAGGEWPQRARGAALAAANSKALGEEQSLGVLLLGDLKAMFEGSDVNSLFSEDIVFRLVEMEDRPWAEFSRGRPISKSQVARLLKPFGVSSVSIRGSQKNLKGYKLSSLVDAFDRYLVDMSVAPSQLNEINN